MADIKKFLDQAGVGTLWKRVAEELDKKATVVALDEVKGTANKAAEDIGKLTTYVGTLPDGTEATTVVEYVNKKTEGIATDAALGELQQAVNTNTAAIGENAAAIEKLNGNDQVVGSVDYKVAQEVAKILNDNDASDIDTLNEIAAWITSDTTGAVGMANDIAALEALVGNTAVATQIANAIDEALKVEGADKYALASELTALADRVKALEDALGEGGSVAGQITNALAGLTVVDEEVTTQYIAEVHQTNGKISVVRADIPVRTIATGTANGTIAVNGTDVAVKGLKSAAYAETSAFDAAGAAATAETNAKAYTDTEINTKVIALTEAEIDQAIANAKAEMNPAE